MPVNMPEKRVLAEPAKILSEPLQISVIHRLIGKGQHFVFQPVRANFANKIVSQVLRQINAGHKRTACCAGFFHIETHDTLPQSIFYGYPKKCGEKHRMSTPPLCYPSPASLDPKQTPVKLAT